MQNHVITTSAQKVLLLDMSLVFKKIKYFIFFPIVKLNANLAEICRVGKL